MPSYMTYSIGGVTFDAVPSESTSGNSGLETLTTISKKIIYWIGANTESITLQCPYMTGSVRDQILALIAAQEMSLNPAISFYDGIDTKSVLIASFNTNIITGIEDAGGLYSASLTLQVIS